MREIMQMLAEFKRQEIEEAKQLQKHHKECERKRKERMKLAQRTMMPNLEKARQRDYEGWLVGYWENGGRPTHYYNRPFSPEDWFVAIADFAIVPLYGASSFQIIIPVGIQPSGGELGHLNLYFMQDYMQRGGWVPIYEDTLETFQIKAAAK